MLFRPEWVAAAGLLAFLAAWLVAPIELAFPVSVGSLLYVGACYAMFFLGCVLVRRPGRAVPAPAAGEPRRVQGWLFWATAALGATGVALRFYDKFVLRSGGLGSGALELRAALSEVQAGPLAAVGGALFPFCYVPLIIFWVADTGRRRSFLQKSIALGLFVLPALDALLLLSRSQMLVALGMMYFAACCSLYQGHPLPRQLRLVIVGGVVSLSIISAWAFSSRLSQMGLQLDDSILDSAYGYIVTPQRWVLEAMQEDTFVGGFLSGIVPLLQYYLHGLFEFGLLWDRPYSQEFTYGSQLFAPYVKALSLFGFIDAPANPLEAYLRVGVFTSFFGPLWIDFGWFGLPFMLLFGAACKYVARRAKADKAAALPLHAYLCVVLFFMPVVNFLVSAQGMYVVNALLLFWLLASARRQRPAWRAAPALPPRGIGERG